MKLAFFGTPQFAEIVLKKLIESKEYKPSLVVTGPDKPVGRPARRSRGAGGKKELTPPPVKVLAQESGTKVAQPVKLNEKSMTDHGLHVADYDLFIVAAYGSILPKALLDAPKKGTVNVHASLLPRWRGPSPIQAAILHGDTVTGNTIMRVDEQMDHGPILAQRELETPISKSRIPNKSQIANYQTIKDKALEELNAQELSNILAHHGAHLLVETLPKWLNGKIEPKEQDHTSATYSKIITRSDGHIDWSKAVDDIERMNRAYTPWPGLFTAWNGKRLKLFNISVHKQRVEAEEYGKVIPWDAGFAVQTKNGIVIPEAVQIEGKSRQDPAEFLKGYSEIINSYLN